MSMPFDATLKDLGRDYPIDLLTTFGHPPTGAISLLNVDLSTITTAADLIIGIGEPLEHVIHVDFQSSANAWKHADILTYNALIHTEYHVPVHSLVILLRPQASHSNLNGLVSYSTARGRGSMNFVYEVVRLWEFPAETLLKGAIGALPFAVLGALPGNVPLLDGLTSVVQQIIERVEKELTADQIRKLLTAAFLLSGMRVTREIARQAFRGVRTMRDSDTYLAILDEGREEEAREWIKLLAEQRFGPCEEQILTQLNSITDLDRLHRIRLRLLTTIGWQDLLQTP